MIEPFRGPDNDLLLGHPKPNGFLGTILEDGIMMHYGVLFFYLILNSVVDFGINKTIEVPLELILDRVFSAYIIDNIIVRCSEAFPGSVRSRLHIKARTGPLTSQSPFPCATSWSPARYDSLAQQVRWVRNVRANKLCQSQQTLLESTRRTRLVEQNTCLNSWPSSSWLGDRGGTGSICTRQKPARRGKSRQRQKTRQTVQLQTSKIHKTRRQAGGFYCQQLGTSRCKAKSWQVRVCLVRNRPNQVNKNIWYVPTRYLWGCS